MLIIVAAVAFAAAATWLGATALLTWMWFGQDEGAVPSCEREFHREDWLRDMKATGRAIAKCDWLDGALAGARAAL